MATTIQSLKAFLDAADRTALVEVTRARGSTPREAGAYMLVSPAATHGTIGGGQLEYMAIDQARQMLAQTASPLARRRSATEGAEASVVLDVPLGPEIGQCCGGRVEVSVKLLDEELKTRLIDAAEADAARMPSVYVFGGGHVGLALANALSLLPLRTTLVETRADALAGMPAGIETRLTPMPEEAVRAAPSGSAFVVLTHDHALDFIIVAEALRRDDAAYVGMIGSKTKRATFRNWFLKSASGSEAAFGRLVSPIGGDAVKDKRPEVIAALAAAEIMTALATVPADAQRGLPA